MRMRVTNRSEQWDGQRVIYTANLVTTEPVRDAALGSVSISSPDKQQLAGLDVGGVCELTWKPDQ